MPAHDITARIFLSYARGDDEPFVRRLHADLTAHGFDVWFDRLNMPSRALTFLQEIKDAIRARDRLVLVLGPKAAVSEYVTEEWRFAWESEKPVVPILRLGDVTLLPDLLKFYHCEDFRSEEARGYEFHLAQLVRILSDPEPPLGKLFAVPSLPPHFLAQPDRLRALKDAVLEDLHKPVVIKGACARVGVHGMGGIGKSVLASVLAHDRNVRQAFPDGVFWLPFGQQAQERLLNLQREVAVALGGDGLFDNETQGKAQLRELCITKAALFVLDDIWDSSHAVAFDVLGPRCRALITTRDTGLLNNLRATEYRVELLSDPDALALLAKSSGNAIEALPAAAHEVARECDHLPLALALCGGMAHGAEGIDWNTILEALRGAELEEISTDHPMVRDHANLWKAITLSIQQLSGDEQQRFAELAVFPEDEAVPEAVIHTFWSHTGGLKRIALEKLIKRLSERALIQLDQKTDALGNVRRRISLHDLLHDYATRMKKGQADSLTSDAPNDREEAFRPGNPLASMHRSLLDAYRKKCPNGWASAPDDGYFKKNLPLHLVEGGCLDELVSLIWDPTANYLTRWIERGESEIGLRCMPGLFEHLRHVRLQPVAAAGIGTQIARLHAARGNYAECERYLTGAIECTSEQAGRRERAIALHERGSIRLYQGDRLEARAAYREALLLCNYTDPVYHDEAAANLVGLATIEFREHKYKKAARLSERALKRATTCDDLRHMIAAHSLMASVCKECGQWTNAENHLFTASILANSAGLKGEIASLSLIQGWMDYSRAILEKFESAQASTHFQAALGAAQEARQMARVSEARLGLAWCAFAMNNLKEAQFWIDQLLAFQFDERSRWHTTMNMLGQAICLHQEQKFKQALEKYLIVINYARLHHEVACEADAWVCSAPLKVGQEPVMFRRLVDGVGCIG
jgi:tetratricopeptide (TPR) repeat protein